jgi:chaperonin GroES
MKAAKQDVLIVPPDKFTIIDQSEVNARLNREMQEEVAGVPGHGIDPIEYKVVVRPVKAAEKTKGGIVLPEQVIEKDQHAAMEGELVAVSPFAFTYEEWPAGARKPKPGDRVLFARYSGITQRGADGSDYRIMNDKDVVAVLRGRA